MIHAYADFDTVGLEEPDTVSTGIYFMIAPLFALFCAVSLNFVGPLDQATDMTVGIMLIWGFAVFFLPRPTQTGWRLLLVAALIRLVLLPIDAGDMSPYPLLLSDAAILWDGGNPYIGPNPSYFSPLKLWLFAPLTEAGTWLPRLFAAAFDVALVGGLVHFLSSRSRRTDGAWIYAIHPLGAVEGAVHGNLDALMLICAILATMAWSSSRSGLGWASLGSLLGGLPIVMFPALWKRGKWILGLTVLFTLIILLPITNSETPIWNGIKTGITGNALPGILPMISTWMNPMFMHGLCTLLAAVLVVLIWRRWKDPMDILLWSASGWIVLAATIDPTAILWVWIPSLLCGIRSWSVLATLAPLAYLCLEPIDLYLLESTSKEWIPWVVFLPFLLSFAVEFARHQTRPGPWRIGPAKTTLQSPSLI